MATFNLFQYDTLLLYRSNANTLRVIGQATDTHDTWVNHAGLNDDYSTAYLAAITACTHMYVDYKTLSAFDVNDKANFVPNLEYLNLNDCTLMTTANVTSFANLVSFSISNTSLFDNVFAQLPMDKSLDLIDVSNTRNITHVPSANTIIAAHSMLTNIDPAISKVKRLIANNARITTVQATDQTSVIIWSYSGRKLTITGATNNLTVLTPQAVTDVVGSMGSMVVLPMSYFAL